MTLVTNLSLDLILSVVEHRHLVFCAGSFLTGPRVFGLFSVLSRLPPPKPHSRGLSYLPTPGRIPVQILPRRATTRPGDPQSICSNDTVINRGPTIAKLTTYDKLVPSTFLCCGYSCSRLSSSYSPPSFSFSYSCRRRVAPAVPETHETTLIITSYDGQCKSSERYPQEACHHW